jgi:oligopeptide/dipeptide ABC transporter ATP-binding protein
MSGTSTGSHFTGGTHTNGTQTNGSQMSSQTTNGRTSSWEEPTPVLEVTNLRVRFHQRGQTVRAVNGISYSVRAGETLAIIGESGSGKTVESRAVMGLLPDNAEVDGSVRLDGVELLGLSEKEMRQHRGTDLATVFQDPARSLNPTMRVGPQISEAIRLHEDINREEAKERAVQLLRLVRLPAPERRYYEYPHQMSGGMRQRVMIAIALSCRPKVLIADEATTALDVTTQAKIMELLADLQQEFNMAVIMISHNLGLAASYADSVMVMYAGQVVEYADTKTLFADVRMPYTKLLLDATPRLDRVAHTSLPAMAQGPPPDLRKLAVGCAFAPRCPHAQDKCRESAPPLVVTGATNQAEGGTEHGYACWFPLSLEVASR